MDLSSNTTKLNLYKKNPDTDGNDTFNIETMLNENWDKIDQNVATLEDVQQSETNANDYTDTKFSNVSYPVTTVNAKTGNVSLTKSDIGLGNVDNVQQASKTEFNELKQSTLSHSADDMAHGIGDKTTLQTTNNTTIVGAINELFTNVSDGKSLVGGAITDVDPNVLIPTEPTFQELANAIGGISSGKKLASGSITPSVSGDFDIPVNLDFIPSVFIAKWALSYHAIGFYDPSDESVWRSYTSSYEKKVYEPSNTYNVKVSGASSSYEIYWLAYE
jgi:hypothetical protein